MHDSSITSHSLVDTELAWVAGFFDGEGCTTTSAHSVRFQIVQTEEAPLHRVRRAFGGLGRVVSRKTSGLGKKPQWVYVLTHRRDVLFALTLIWRFLGDTKRKQAATAFAKVPIHARIMRRYGGNFCIRGHERTPENSKVGKRQTSCRECCKEATRRWRNRNPEKVKIWKRAHHARKRAAQCVTV